MILDSINNNSLVIVNNILWCHCVSDVDMCDIVIDADIVM